MFSISLVLSTTFSWIYLYTLTTPYCIENEEINEQTNARRNKQIKLATISQSLLKQYGLNYLASPGSGLQRVAMVILKALGYVKEKLNMPH